MKLSSANVWLGRRLAAVITFSLVLSNSQAVYSLLINLQQLLSLLEQVELPTQTWILLLLNQVLMGGAMILLLFILVLNHSLSKLKAVIKRHLIAHL
ncbi:hypothetical protein B9P99_02150 [Candidatus Marsarchaeota G1 archaeon OSP_B]|uniref:Uncharacterized protein n=4 Tax=Candidatus Marsarchaeota group 1 TaxID=2203770 RepID=A0A2R6AJW8_9ARCH|nr:MAG: hypothetical protein B9Q01_02205 [Candidatus Marsarchaeota G1 archaeon OSP_D]PSN86657.1 MAG: hypothetical protein B9Q02_01460 [Candidatus Marsarchaeota G1 archaeon BE_D]PSN89072.1 MAG: hypothetical protein B9Q00_02810 [Candidatus Marsarchaeota G1 archaeon OSP_C]PSN93770.1 MAG: hypothetical protein B9P99_02150 [Candidatus Marsarchaeota G1 archaeon OSP_B]